MFVKMSSKLTDELKIQVDNKFIMYFMPSAPSDYTKVYLYGLCLTSTNSELMNKENSLERISKSLNLDTQTIINAYEYWAGIGIVNLDNSVYPPIVEYLPTLDTKYSVIKKYNIKKYADFNSQLAKMLPKRNFLPQELNEYYQVMEALGTQPNAMLCIISYCVRLKGDDISSNYILTVARNLAKNGLLSVEAVENNLNELKLYENDIQDIFKSLKIRRAVDHSDKDYFVKWTKSLKYNKDTILYIAKKINKGGMDALDKRLQKYHNIKLMSIKEIQDYEDEYDKMYTLAKETCKRLGVYYERYDTVVDEYITEWIAMGFDSEGILRIADLCQKSNKRNMDMLRKEIHNFYKQGLIKVESITELENKTKIADQFIEKLLKIVGVNRTVNSRDRDYYNTWVNSWLMPKELIEYGASLSESTQNPFGYLNKVLDNWRHKDIKTVDQAKKETPTTKSSTKNSKTQNPAAIQNSYKETPLTDADINAIFDNLTYEDL